MTKYVLATLIPVMTMMLIASAHAQSVFRGRNADTVFAPQPIVQQPAPQTCTTLCTPVGGGMQNCITTCN